MKRTALFGAALALVITFTGATAWTQDKPQVIQDATKESVLVTVVTPGGGHEAIQRTTWDNEMNGFYKVTYGMRPETTLEVGPVLKDGLVRVTVTSIRGSSPTQALILSDPETGMLTIYFIEAEHWRYELQYTPLDGGFFYGTLKNAVEEWAVRFNRR